MLIQHGGQHEPLAIYFPQYLAWQLVGGEGDFDILVLVPNINSMKSEKFIFIYLNTETVDQLSYGMM